MESLGSPRGIPFSVRWQRDIALDYLELALSVDLRPRQLRTECGLLDVLGKAL